MAAITHSPDQSQADQSQADQAQAEAEQTARRPAAPIAPGDATSQPHSAYLRIGRAIATIANAAPSVEDGVREALACFGRHTGWPVGHAFLEQTDDVSRPLASGPWWCRDDFDGASLVAATRGLTVRAGHGALGRVVASGAPRWLDGELRSDDCERADVARRMNLRSGLLGPVRVRNRVVGVIEFYSDRAARCEPGLLDAVAHLGTELGRLVERERFERRLARLAEREQRRLGRELHDTLSQQLTGIGMLARSLERKLEAAERPEAERARSLVESVQDARTRLRAIARGLNPVLVGAEGLSTALERLAEETARVYGVRCTHVERTPLVLKDDFVANQLLCIVREAVHNAARHAAADLVEIEARVGEPRTLEVVVRDDGRGFDVEGVASDGMGLVVMRHRARTIGARLRVRSREGFGTTVVCALRKEHEE